MWVAGYLALFAVTSKNLNLTQPQYPTVPKASFGFIVNVAKAQTVYNSGERAKSWRSHFVSVGRSALAVEEYDQIIIQIKKRIGYMFEDNRAFSLMRMLLQLNFRFCLLCQAL